MSEPDLRYELLDTLGSGGFGTVYRARFVGERGFEKIVALKVLNERAERVDELGQRLRDEARLLAQLRHRSIVHVDRLLLLDGHWSVVMEYVDGVDLRAVLTRTALPPGPAVHVTGEVAGALHHAATATSDDGRPLRLLHRDIKPSNVVITAAGDVKVLDFGVARAEWHLREAKTDALRFGSLAYMAPERHEFRDTPAGDVYSLGAMLFELVTQRPLGRTSPDRKRHESLRDDALKRLSPAPIRELVADLLEFDPEARPTAREVERRCGRLAARLGDDTFRDWAERAVPVAKSLREQDPSGVTDAAITTSGHVHEEISETAWDDVAPPSAHPGLPVTAEPAPMRQNDPTQTMPAFGVTEQAPTPADDYEPTVLGGPALEAALRTDGRLGAIEVLSTQPPPPPRVGSDFDTSPRPAPPVVAEDVVASGPPEISTDELAREHAQGLLDEPMVPPDPEDQLVGHVDAGALALAARRAEIETRARAEADAARRRRRIGLGAVLVVVAMGLTMVLSALAMALALQMSH